MAHTTASSSSSLEYFCSKVVRNLDSKWTALQPSSVFCWSTAPNHSRLASHIILIGWVSLKCFISVICYIAFFILWNASSFSSVHSHVSSLLSSGRNGAQSCAIFGINLFGWLIAPMNDPSSFNFVGFGLSVIA